MKPIQVTQYEMADGTIIEDESEAFEYKVRLESTPHIAHYLDTVADDCAPRTLALIKRHLNDYVLQVAWTNAIFTEE